MFATFDFHKKKKSMKVLCWKYLNFWCMCQICFFCEIKLQDKSFKAMERGLGLLSISYLCNKYPCPGNCSWWTKQLQAIKCLSTGLIMINMTLTELIGNNNEMKRLNVQYPGFSVEGGAGGGTHYYESHSPPLGGQAPPPSSDPPLIFKDHSPRGSKVLDLLLLIFRTRSFYQKIL